MRREGVRGKGRRCGGEMEGADGRFEVNGCSEDGVNYSMTR